jgi:osmoprotectant transport system ATP-binding protein
MLQATAGTVAIDGQAVDQLDPIALRRRIGYVIQDFGLLPHWTVAENVALVPRLLRWPEEKQSRRVRELLEQVGLKQEDFGARRPHQLSGGQRQRVAVARALAAEPGLLLFDEPFGALDPITRHEMQQQFLELRSRYNVASVFVTHDLMEALSIATRIAVLDYGKLETLVTPAEFFSVRTPIARAFLSTLPPEMLKENRR